MENIISRSNEILVSVVVVTYNSSSTILETLDSVANQSYTNIELIISDDCSKDDTLNVCKKWLNQYGKRFCGFKLITSNENTGTSGNLNRGIKESRGKWIKTIAGDDRLLPWCIESNIDFINKNKEADLVFSRVRYFGELERLRGHKEFSFENFELSNNEFYKRILSGNFLPASTAFIRYSLFMELGLYDESIPLLEDWPYWIRASRAGYIFMFNNVETVEYRLQNSVSFATVKSEKYLDSERKARNFSLKYQLRDYPLLWLKNKSIYLVSDILRFIRNR